MTSERKIVANQRNGHNSRGPNTASGKSRSSQNARRHGLNTIHRGNPAFSDEIENLAKEICAGRLEPLLFEQALIIAENEILLRCVQAERVAAIERYRDPAAVRLTNVYSTFAQAKARICETNAAIDELKVIDARLAELRPRESKPFSGPSGPLWQITPEFERLLCSPEAPRQPSKRKKAQKPQPAAVWKRHEERDEHIAVRAAIPELVKLGRYERQAWSRRKRAIRHLMKVRSAITRFQARAAGNDATERAEARGQQG